jgi:hypothetical protein
MPALLLIYLVFLIFHVVVSLFFLQRCSSIPSQLHDYRRLFSSRLNISITTTGPVDLSGYPA